MNLLNNNINERGATMSENEGYILQEAKKHSKNKRKYKCPYCDFRAIRHVLVEHVENVHSDYISDEFPASRIVFNSINKKKHGTCIVCGTKTKWNDDVWRYERICSDRCRGIFYEEKKSKIVDKYGKAHLLNDPEQQQKMLNNRKISGEYRHSDGGRLSYVGSYEKNLLEFMDSVMNIPSKHIQTPGPILSYEFKGDELVWITDMYYEPYNLIIEVKHGGKNKNTHPGMKENAEKQRAKDLLFTNKGLNYNYLKITDNNFAQLLHIFAELKFNMVNEENDSDIKNIIHINESNILENLKSSTDNKGYVVCIIENGFYISNVGFSKTIDLENIITVDENCNLVVNKKSTYNNCDFVMVQLENINDEYFELLKKISTNEFVSCDYIKESFLPNANESHITSPYKFIDLLEENYNIIHTDNDLSSYCINEFIKDISNCISEDILNEANGTLCEIDLFTRDINTRYPHIKIFESYGGYFAKNIITNKRTPYVLDYRDISRIHIEMIKDVQSIKSRDDILAYNS